MASNINNVFVSGSLRSVIISAQDNSGPNELANLFNCDTCVSACACANACVEKKEMTFVER